MNAFHRRDAPSLRLPAEYLGLAAQALLQRRYRAWHKSRRPLPADIGGEQVAGGEIETED